MRTALQIVNASWLSIGVRHKADSPSAFEVKAKQLGLAYPLGNEYRDQQPDEQMVAGQAFAPGVVLETVEGMWALESIRAYALMTGEPWTAPPAGGGERLAYLFPQVLVDIGALGDEGAPAAGLPFYRLSGAAVRRGVNAFAVVTVLGRSGRPAVNATVCNLFPDGNGEWLATDGTGTVQFSFGANSAFSNPGGGEFTVFIADQASKDKDAAPKVLRWGKKLSDVVRSLGDYQGEHTEIYLQFAEQPA